MNIFKRAFLRLVKRLLGREFIEALMLVGPLLETNPTWKWDDAVEHLHRTGAAIPPGNWWLSLDRMERRGQRRAPR
jgi:hypothetical protein